jgi:hypothetical protein
MDRWLASMAAFFDRRLRGKYASIEALRGLFAGGL